MRSCFTPDVHGRISFALNIIRLLFFSPFESSDSWRGWSKGETEQQSYRRSGGNRAGGEGHCVNRHITTSIKMTVKSSSDLSQAALGTSHLRTFGRHFIDGYGRIVQLRGVNVSGASKLPSRPDGLSYLPPEKFFDHEHVSFVGRPFPLAEAPKHMSRLKAWGLTLIRLLITWESLAHAGPNPETDMDEEYLDYLHALLSMMSENGFKVIICAHQDVWSRFSGGSGAPGWTFEKAGLDIESFKATGAAYVDVLNASASEAEVSEEDVKGNNDGVDQESTSSQNKKKAEPLGAFVWPSGYQKLGAATMATLFWAGEVFAWKLRLPHYDRSASRKSLINIQEYLQSSYIEAFGRLIDRVGMLDAVIGVDIMNEPHRGYVGVSDWNKWNYETDLHIGQFPSLLQSLALGSGHRQAVPFYVKSWPFPTRQTHKSIIDPLGKSAWLKDAGLGQCVWRAHGAWEWDEQRGQPVIMRQDYFTRDPRPGSTNERIEWYRDFYAPFLVKFTERMRRTAPHLFPFVEPIPNEFMPPWSHPETVSGLTADDRLELMKASFGQDYATKTFIDVPRPKGLIYAPHFYDLNVLFGKLYHDMSVNVQRLSRGYFILRALHFGVEGLKENYMRQITAVKKNGQLSLGSVPMVIGEVGIPWDINGRAALYNGDYLKHVELLDALIRAMEQNQLGFTLWNYNPDNSTAKGDGWNMEDFSIVCNVKESLDIDNSRQSDDLYRGGRGLEAIIRPYAVKVAGFPFETRWEKDNLFFEFHYVNGPTESLSLLGPEAKAMQKRTEIYLPLYHFDEGHELRIQVKDGTYELDRDSQSLYLDHIEMAPGYEHIVRVSVLGKVPKKRSSRAWYQLSIQDTCTLISLAGVLVFVLLLSDYVVKPYFENLERQEAAERAASTSV